VAQNDNINKKTLNKLTQIYMSMFIKALVLNPIRHHTHKNMLCKFEDNSRHFSNVSMPQRQKKVEVETLMGS